MAEKESDSNEYSAAKFNKYIGALKAKCRGSKSGFIFNALARDPITQFVKKHKDDSTAKSATYFYAERRTTTTEQKSNSDDDEAEASAETAGRAGNLNVVDFKTLKREFKKDPEHFAVKFLEQVEELGIGSDAEQEVLRKNLLKWTNAEAEIYSIISKTLDKATQFKTTANAGRYQLESLIKAHKNINKKVGKTLKKIFEKFTYVRTGGPDGAGEGLDRYYYRLLDLIANMETAHVHRDEDEQLDAYVEGLKRADMFTKELSMCEIAEKNLVETHNYLLKREDKTSTQLLYQHGMKTKDVSNVGADIGAATAGKNAGGKPKQLCRNWCYYGECRFGDNCFHEHPDFLAKDKRPKRSVPSTTANKPLTELQEKCRKKGICFSFAEKGSCPRGDKCKFKHEKLEANNTELTEEASAEIDANAFHFADVSNLEISNGHDDDVNEFCTVQEASEDASTNEFCTVEEVGQEDFNFNNKDFEGADESNDSDVLFAEDSNSSSEPEHAIATPDRTPKPQSDRTPGSTPPTPDHVTRVTDNLTKFQYVDPDTGNTVTVTRYYDEDTGNIYQEKHRQEYYNSAPRRPQRSPPNAAAAANRQRLLRQRRRRQRQRQQRNKKTKKRKKKQEKLPRNSFRPKRKRRGFTRLIHVDRAEQKQIDRDGFNTTTSNDSGGDGDSSSGEGDCNLNSKQIPYLFFQFLLLFYSMTQIFLFKPVTNSRTSTFSPVFTTILVNILPEVSGILLKTPKLIKQTCISVRNFFKIPPTNRRERRRTTKINRKRLRKFYKSIEKQTRQKLKEKLDSENRIRTETWKLTKEINKWKHKLQKYNFEEHFQQQNENTTHDCNCRCCTKDINNIENCTKDVNNIEYDSNGKDKDTRPIIDSGASHSVTPYTHHLTNVKNGNFGTLRGVTGTTKINKSGTLTNIPGGTIDDVLVVETAARPLISTESILKQFGGYLILGSKQVIHVSTKNKRTILGPRTKNGWYRLERLPPKTKNIETNNLTLTNQIKREQINRLHRNMGHASANKLRQILSHTSIYGLHPTDVKLLQKCMSCGLGKPRRASHKKSTKPTEAFGTHIDTDNTARQPVQTKSGKKVVNVILCRHTNWLFSAALSSIKESVDRLRYVIKRELNSVTKVVRSDQGGEFLNYALDELLDEVGAVHQTSASGVSQQNGAAEKCIQDIMRDVRTVLADSGLPLSFWGEALNYCTFTKNRRPCYANPDNISPYEARYGIIPDYKRLQPFGQACTAMYPKKKAPDKKIGDQALKGIMVGYDDCDGTKAYRVYIPHLKKILVTPDVTFMDFKATTGLTPDVEQLTDTPFYNKSRNEEHKSSQQNNQKETPKVFQQVLPKEPTSMTKIQDQIPNSRLQPTETKIQISEEEPYTETKQQCEDPTHTKTKSEEIIIEDCPVTTSAPQTRTSPRRSTRTNRSRQNYSEPKRIGWYEKDTNMLELEKCRTDFEVYLANVHGHVNYTSKYTPKDYDDAMSTPEHKLWQESMDRENQSIKENDVYDKIKRNNLPKNINVISGKWVYKVKPTSTGEVSVYKSRIVARGFQGRLGVDYTETYSPVAGATTIRLILALATSMNLHLRGADIKTAFLYAEQIRKVYFKPPKGADCGEDEVWLLKKALYGLKDAPLRWHETLSKFLKNIGMKQAKSDPCLFFKKDSNGYCFMTITVDDLLIATTTKKQADNLLQEMEGRFKLKDMGEPEYIIGIHIDYNRKDRTLKLNQRLYIETITEKFKQTKAKPEILPATSSTKIDKDMGSPPTDKPYRSLIGSLIYATLTRPDISTIVSQLSRVLESPQEAHWNAGIRVLRYLYHTRNFSLTYKPEKDLRRQEHIGDNLLGYTDSTWNTEEKSRSRTGYLCIFNGCTISWKSKVQPNIARSSCEAEYIALNEGGSEIMWIRKILYELGLLKEQCPTLILIDNQPAIGLAKHKMIKQRTKHIQLKYDWIKEQVENKVFDVNYINTKENLADFFTKNLAKGSTSTKGTFEYFKNKIMK